MSWMRYFIVAVSVVSVLSACTSRPSDTEDFDVAQLATMTEDTLSCDIYVDATLSMQGYVIPTYTRYKELLGTLESSLTSTWPNGEVTFYRFGSKVGRINRNTYLEATLESFYRDPEYFHITLIDKVIEQANLDHLTLIVTDLFQDFSDINRVTNLIRSRYFNNDLAVGIIGLMSGFNGTVYDIGPNALGFKYTGERPVYVLMLGKQADIAAAYERINSRLTSSDGSKILIVSGHITDRILTFRDGRVQNLENLVVDRNVLHGEVLPPHVKQFQVRRSPSSFILPVSLEQRIAPYGAVPSARSLLYETKIAYWNTTNREFEPVSEVISNEAETEFLATQKELFIQNRIFTKQHRSGIYRFETEVYINPVMFFPPEWVREWTLDMNELPKWEAKPSTFPGHQTLNLNQFVNDLLESSLQMHRPVIAYLKYYVKQ